MSGVIVTVLLGVAFSVTLFVVRHAWDEYLMLLQYKIDRECDVVRRDSVSLEFKLLDANGKVPFKERQTDAAWDIFASEDIKVYAGTHQKVRTDLALAPPPGWYYTFNGRSGLTKKGIVVLRGIIDSGYTGEVGVVLFNASDSTYQVKRGDRIAQMTVHKVYNVDFREVEEFSPAYSLRGSRGWGSSGS